MSIKGNSDEEEELQNPPRHRSHRAQIPLSPPPPPIIEASDDLPQSPYSHWHGSRIQQSSQSSPTIEVDDDDLEQSSHRHSPPREVDNQIMHDPSRSPSPQTGSKRQHNLNSSDDTNEDENDEKLEEDDAHISKAQKTSKKTSRPKAGDYDEIGKELVLAAANLYRALLASQGAFPNPSKEIELIKKSWKLANSESGVNPLALTPSIVTIVSNSLLLEAS